MRLKFDKRELAAVLFTLLLCALIGISAVRAYAHRTKHTGPVLYTHRKTVSCLWFMRQNGEIFESCFDNPPPFQNLMQLDDITYTDDSADLRHFVKAKLAKDVITPEALAALERKTK